jgi:hypothetical protein
MPVEAAIAAPASAARSVPAAIATLASTARLAIAAPASGANYRTRMRWVNKKRRLAASSARHVEAAIAAPASSATRPDKRKWPRLSCGRSWLIKNVILPTPTKNVPRQSTATGVGPMRHD